MAVNLIRLSRSDITEAEIHAVNEVMTNGFLGMGSVVQDFEDRLKTMMGRGVGCVSSGTAALHLALQSLNLQPSDEVITPDLTYVATLQAISATGARPVICDVETESYGLCFQAVKRAISNRTKAIIIVHYAGRPANDYKLIIDLAKERGIRVVEDAAHAFGSKFENKYIGSTGDIVCFSFDGIKNITCGEGGCVVTDDPTLLQAVNDARLLGVKNDSARRFAGERSFKFDVVEQGWRYHMQNINAAIGIEQLKRLDNFRLTKYQLWKNYHNGFKESSVITPVLRDPDRNIVPHIYPIILPNPEIKERCQKALTKNNIQHGVHYQPNSSLSFYKQSKVNTPNTYWYFERSLTLPFQTLLRSDEQKLIIDILREIKI